VKRKMPLPDYEKKQYKKTRTMPGAWYLSNYKYKFNLSRMKIMLRGFKEGKILGVKCRSCNHVSFPPKLICGRCLVMPDQWVTLPDTGSVATGSGTPKTNKETGEVVIEPVILVRQDGADTVWIHNLPENYSFHDVYIGMPVKVHWAVEKQGLWSDIEYYDPIEDMGDKINKEAQGK
jgi:hypothetical protein